MTDVQIRKLAEKVALEQYPESYQNEYLSERKYFMKGFLKGAQDIKDGCYIKHEILYSYVYNKYIEIGAELNAVVKKMLPPKEGLQTGTIEHLHQFVVRGYEKAEKYIKLNRDYEYAFNDYWKDNLMDARLKVLHLSEEQKTKIKIEIGLAFIAGCKQKQ